VTGLEYLRKRARIAYALPLAPLLPGLLALAVALVGRGSEHGLVQFCSNYWWTMLGVGALACFVAMVVGARVLRCPFCRFQLSTAGAGPIQFVSGSSAVRFCPHCGTDLTRAVRSDEGA
jgi:hypothetical protein